MSNAGFADKTILLVNTGSIKKRFILRKLKKLGLTVVCLNKEKNWADKYVNHWILADNTNHNESLQATREFIDNNPKIKINGALTFWEDDVLLTSKITDKFNLIGIPFNIAKKVRNKFLFREFCRKNEIPAPRHNIIIKSASNIANLPEDFSFPAVIKPSYGASSAYVIKVNDKDELLNTFNYIKKNISTVTESALSEGMEIFIEEYIGGDEVDVDIILQNGKIKFYSISDNFQTKEPFFVETSQSIPSTLPNKNQEELIDLAAETLEKLGIQNGIVHFEAKSTPTGPVPIEINLRMGGDYVYSYIKGCWGIDFIEYAVKIATGEYIKIKKIENPKKYIIGEDLRTDYSGVLVKLNINEEIKKIPFVEEVHFYKKIGDPIFAPPEGYDNMGWITVSGYGLVDAQDNLKEAEKNIEYEIVKFASESSIGKTSRKNSFSHAYLNANLIMRAAKIEKIKRIGKEGQKKLHLGIVCNLPEESNGLLSHVLSQNVAETLNNRGYKTTIFDFNNPENALNEIKNSDIDLIFNLCEKINDSFLLKPCSAALLDVLQIPYTGSDAATLSLCLDKIKVKKLLTYHNIPTPRWDYIYSLEDEIDPSLRYPQIIKPANTDNSLGITNKSVVTNADDRQKQLKKIMDEIGDQILIEEYIAGDEYDVSILGNEEDDIRVLPLSRSIFTNPSTDAWHIYTREIKLDRNNLADKGIILQRPAKNISKKLETLLTEIALDAYNIFDCRDYGCVEIRVDKDDNPYLLELNPNPSININDCLPEVAKLTNLEYGDFLEDIIRLAIKRYKNKNPMLNFNL